MRSSRPREKGARSTANPAATATSKPPDPVAPPSTSGAVKPPPTSSAPRTARGGGDGRALLRSGDIAAAARAFQQEISSGSADKFTLALAQLNAVVGDIEGNLKKARDVRGGAAEAGADLIAFSELYLTG